MLIRKYSEEENRDIRIDEKPGCVAFFSASVYYSLKFLKRAIQMKYVVSHMRFPDCIDITNQVGNRHGCPILRGDKCVGETTPS